MNVEPYNFVSALNCVLAQRLVRKVCPNCAERITYSVDILEESRIPVALAAEAEFYQGKGCLDCNGTGFRGRMAISEILELSDHIRELILDRKPASEIKKAAREEGMATLRESAVHQFLMGRTTLKEINKVSFVEETHR